MVHNLLAHLARVLHSWTAAQRKAVEVVEVALADESSIQDSSLGMDQNTHYTGKCVMVVVVAEGTAMVPVVQQLVAGEEGGRGKEMEYIL